MHDRMQRIILETIRQAVKREVRREVKRLRLCIVDNVKAEPNVEYLNGVTEPSPQSIWATNEDELCDNGIE